MGLRLGVSAATTRGLGAADMAELGAWYYTAVAVAGVLMVYHQWLARDRQSANCFKAFLHNHYIGMIVFIGIVLHYTFNPVISG